ncbi:hypothetical protein GPK34_00690 [Secundilactobacillus kimchicus]|nr:hypothetical protein [Secundilactobacillus kimchicus]
MTLQDTVVGVTTDWNKLKDNTICPYNSLAGNAAPDKSIMRVDTLGMVLTLRNNQRTAMLQIAIPQSIDSGTIAYRLGVYGLIGVSWQYLPNTSNINELITQQVQEVAENVQDGKNGKDGKDGSPGKDAYQLAVDKGYKGTEEEWLKTFGGSLSEVLKDYPTNEQMTAAITNATPKLPDSLVSINADGETVSAKEQTGMFFKDVNVAEGQNVNDILYSLAATQGIGKITINYKAAGVTLDHTISGTFEANGARCFVTAYDNGTPTAVGNVWFISAYAEGTNRGVFWNKLVTQDYLTGQLADFKDNIMKSVVRRDPNSGKILDKADFNYGDLTIEGDHVTAIEKVDNEDAAISREVDHPNTQHEWPVDAPDAASKATVNTTTVKRVPPVTPGE